MPYNIQVAAKKPNRRSNRSLRHRFPPRQAKSPKSPKSTVVSDTGTLCWADCASGGDEEFCVADMVRVRSATIGPSRIIRALRGGHALRDDKCMSDASNEGLEPNVGFEKGGMYNI